MQTIIPVVKILNLGPDFWTRWPVVAAAAPLTRQQESASHPEDGVCVTASVTKVFFPPEPLKKVVPVTDEETAAAALRWRIVGDCFLHWSKDVKTSRSPGSLHQHMPIYPHIYTTQQTRPHCLWLWTTSNETLALERHTFTLTPPRWQEQILK